MLQKEHSAILSTFINQPVVIKTVVLSIFEWPFYTGFTVFSESKTEDPNQISLHRKPADLDLRCFQKWINLGQAGQG